VAGGDDGDRNPCADMVAFLPASSRRLQGSHGDLVEEARLGLLMAQP
jgi:hypothetical protein